MKTEEIASQIVDAAYAVHKEIGPGLLESAYVFCLGEELHSRNMVLQLEQPVPLIYRGKKLKAGYRLDLLVENKVIVECKTVESLLPVHKAQLITYLRLTDLQLGFLINFNEALIKNGIKRVVNNYIPD